MKIQIQKMAGRRRRIRRGRGRCRGRGLKSWAKKKVKKAAQNVVKKKVSSFLKSHPQIADWLPVSKIH